MKELKEKKYPDTGPFWLEKALEEMTDIEWESLCDRCGLCCLNKIEDEDSGEFYYTNVSCSLLDTENCFCVDYEKRTELKGDCLRLTHENISSVKWLPKTCAYRLLNEGLDLPWWHPLLTGSREAMEREGVTTQGRVINEDFVHPDELEDHVVDWVVA